MSEGLDSRANEYAIHHGIAGILFSIIKSAWRDGYDACLRDMSAPKVEDVLCRKS